MGALLYVLTNTPRSFDVEDEKQTAEQAQDVQQIAISKCLEWIVEGVTVSLYGDICRFSQFNPTPAQYLFTKAVARMTVDGEWIDSSEYSVPVLPVTSAGAAGTNLGAFLGREEPEQERTPYQIGRARLQDFMDKEPSIVVEIYRSLKVSMRRIWSA